MTVASLRLLRRIQRDFPQADQAADVERLVSDVASSERVQAAVVLWAAGDMARLHNVLELARLDWRDALVRADLADDNWRTQLDLHLGPG